MPNMTALFVLTVALPESYAETSLRDFRTRELGKTQSVWLFSAKRRLDWRVTDVRRVDYRLVPGT